MKSNLPYNVMRHRDWDVAPRDPVTIGAFIASSIGVTSTVGVFLVTAAVTLAITAVTSWAIQALAPKPKMGVGTQGLITNLRDAAAPREYVYGQVRKGGVITYLESTGTQNKFLHMIIAVAGHQVEEIGDIYINDKIVTIDGGGLVTSAPWNSKIRIQKFLGNQTTAPASLVSASTKVNGNFIGRGIAYLYVRLEYDQDVFAGGIPLFSAVIKGKRVFDPRTSATVYSANAALCIRDYLVSEYGMNDVGSIDETVFSAAANVCDEDVDLATAGVQPRYEMNGVISAALAPGDILQSMMTSCAGTLFWGQGKWQLRPGYYTAPVKDFGLEDLRGPISLSTRTSRRDNFNIVRGTFNNAEARYITQDYPERRGDAFIAEDNGLENALDLMLPLTTDPAMVQRLAKLTLFRGREQITFSADFSVAAFDVQVGDIISLTNSRYGWVEKEFEVLGWRFFASEEAGDLRVKLDLRETSEAAFDWDAEESAIINNNTVLPNAFNVIPPGISLDSELRIINEQVAGVLIINLTGGDTGFNDYFEVEYRPTGASNYIFVGRGQEGRFEVTFLSDGNYDVRARSVSFLGVRSDYTTVSNWYASLFRESPANVQNFTGNAVGGLLHLTWNAVPDLDLSHYKIRYATEVIGAQYQNAVDLVLKVARPAVSVTVPARTGTYFIRAIDKLGIPSPTPSSIVITTNISQVENLNVVELLTEHPDFSGVKTDVVRLSDGPVSFITLDTTNQFDDTSSDFDDALGLFDAGGETGALAASGIYEFSNYVDLGQKYTSRVRVDLKTFFIDYVDTFDSATGVFDEREGDFDGDPSKFDLTSVRAQASFTDDDPSATPSWSDWQDISVSDIAARAIRFRAILETQSDKSAPGITELVAEVDMPDRLDSESDILYTGSRVVTFPVAFNATPAIGIAATLADGDRYVISAKNRSGFTITTLTGVSVSTNPTLFDYVAKGYGRETT